MRRLVVLVLALTTTVTTNVAAAGAAQSQAPGQAPSEHIQRGADPRGVVLDGMQRSGLTDLCRGAFQLNFKDRAVQALCTHGPDPAPDGVDVRDRRPPEAGAAAELLPSGGVAAATSGIQCYGNGSDGYRVQLIYARAGDVADRYGTYAASFLQWAANVDLMADASSAETGGSRHVRYVTDPSCNLVVDRVTMTTSGDDNLSNAISELRAKGYTRTDRKYLVWVDANVYCGIAQVYYDDRANPAPGANYNNGNVQVQGEVARVDNGCWGLGNSVEAHELMHNLGGVQASAPHATANSHCRDEYDRMCYVDAAGVTMTYVCPSSHENRFDCNHDDYFSTSAPTGSYLATHWNTANSAFLATAPGTIPPPTTTTTTTTTTTAPPPTTSTTTTTTTTTKPPTTTTTTTAPTTTTTTTAPPPTTTTTAPPSPAKPSAPRNLTATPLGGGNVALSWLPPTTGPVTGYAIYRGNGFNPPTLVTTVGAVTSFTHLGTPTGLASYYVKAVNGAGEGPASNRAYTVVR